MKSSIYIIFAALFAVLNFVPTDSKCQSSRGGLLSAKTGNLELSAGNQAPYPGSYLLGQNFPNPFNPTTTINYSVAGSGLVTIKVYNLIGKEMATLVNEEKPAGNYSVKFDGSSFSSGVYFYTMKTGDFTQTRKFILMK